MAGITTNMPDRELLAWTIAGEAGRESRVGQDAVAHNILNRVHSGKFGDSISSTIMARGQYSMWNDLTGYAGGKGGISQSLMSRTSPSSFQRYLNVADDALAGRSTDPTGGSLHYYNPNVASPKWGRGSDQWTETATIGNHVFGVAGGKPYDGSTTGDPRNAPDVGYNQFSGADVSSGVQDGSFNDFVDTGDGTNIAPSYSITGEEVSTPKAGTQGQAANVPVAIVTAMDQQAKTTAAAAKTSAEATLKATKDQTESDKTLQTEQQSWAGGWAVRIFLFIIGAIFVAGGLFLFGGKTVAANVLSK